MELRRRHQTSTRRTTSLKCCISCAPFGAGMVEGQLGELTVEERVLLHLLENRLQEGSWDADANNTQAGISSAVHIQRKHLPRTLKRILESEEVLQEMRHVSGSKQRRRVYDLTQKGRSRANDIKERVMSLVITRDGEEVTLESLESTDSILITLSHIDSNRSWNETPLQVPISQGKGDVGIEGKVSEALVKAVFERAWRDGSLSEAERGIVEEIVNFLGMSPERVTRMEQDALNNLSESKGPDRERIYRDLLEQALEDGEIIEEELVMLETLRTTLDIDLEIHGRLVAQVVAHAELLDSLEPHFHPYVDAVRTALEDGIISLDEDAILTSLRRSFNIPTEVHVAIATSIRDNMK
tara:strand:+ start:1724 stop:2788 length:1065 start_codon:yes stop_codon:yes gene_type:complete